ncbi:DeoR/GlpR family DNA-binding transcription regulator [Bacillus sp. FSL K6-3431]|uniref:DeoR/GlpR family DNA-binding transcription regulator n=1 Tax=Bacillus sp. FSL K6-3431 TaxID=2921500 RepID=UPI0030F99A89
MSLLSEERKRVIIELIDQHGRVKVNNLARDFEVSTETVRRYLEALENEKKLKKVYGGAVKIEQEEEPALFEREVLRMEEKQRIAEKAVSFIENGDMIFIDEGSTTLQMVPYLCALSDITVITNSFPVASYLITFSNQRKFNGETIFIGGTVKNNHFRTSGSLAERMAQEFFADKAFIAIDGLDPSRGITSYDIEKSMMTKIYMEQASEIYALADHSKIGKKANYKMAELKAVDKVLSDSDIPDDWTISNDICEWIKC